ncbi:MAG: alpha-hydroxy-acid oxidizing protein [Desulfobacteraceae bacterium]|nr:MAG: alpha-hydroxy-acid oxidizing protein [Desulfobacteraceae bacterium]
MELTDLYQRGEELLRQKDIGFLLDGVETGFILEHDRLILDRYTFKQQCIDATEANTDCDVLGLKLSTPVIMSAMTMPIPAIVDDGLIEVAQGLKESGSLMWTGTPIPQNLKEIIATGVSVAANVKPFQDRKKMFDSIAHIQEAGVRWVGIEIDSGQGTKIRDRMMAADCRPLSRKEIEKIREKVSVPLVFKGVLSASDAQKSVDAGAEAIVVSNHGSHTLDYLPHPLQVMDEIVAAVKAKIVIIVDGGFRRGSDVLKGLAFGASLVGLGRPILYGLSAAGKEGVRGVINGITHELKRIMTMVGTSEPGQIHRDVLIID